MLDYYQVRLSEERVESLLSNKMILSANTQAGLTASCHLPVHYSLLSCLQLDSVWMTFNYQMIPPIIIPSVMTACSRCKFSLHWTTYYALLGLSGAWQLQRYTSFMMIFTLFPSSYCLTPSPAEVTLDLTRQYFLSSQLIWARNWYSLNVAVIVVWDWQSNDINQSISSVTAQHLQPASCLPSQDWVWR